MPFDFRAWKACVLSSANDVIDRFDLLVASGLVEDDDLEVAFEKLMDELQIEIAAKQRPAAGGTAGDRHG